MTTEGLIALDLLAGVATTVAWLGAGVTATAQRARPALAIFAVAVLLSLIRAGLTLALLPAGWWFVQEKLTLTLPLLVIAGLTAAGLAGPRLVSAARVKESAPVQAQPGQRADPVRQSPAFGPGVVVPLLGAGYAAAAGPVVTLLTGYPATWSTGLITLALVGAAVLVTWQAVPSPVPSPVRAPGAAPLRIAVVAAVLVGLFGTGLAFVPEEEVDTGGGPAATGHHAEHGRPVTALRGPDTPADGGTLRRFTLTARTAGITLSSGRRVEAWTFDGQVPGPPITATEGDLVEVTLRNTDISPGVTLHWHGYDVASGDDGVPGLTQEAVMPGQEFVYRFLADQAGTYWYHTHEVSDRGVKLGLYGTLVVAPRSSPGPAAAAGVDLTLPVHTFAGTTVLGDHDQPIEQRAAAGTPVRLRLINTDNTPHQFTLSDTAYQVAALDGRDLNGPGELSRTTLRLPAGGRYDLVFPMPAQGAALLVDGRADGGLRLAPEGTAAPVTTVDTSGWPVFDPTVYGTPAGTPFGADSHFDRDFTLVLDRGLALVGNRPMYAHTVNGRAFPSIPSQLVSEGDLVHVTVANRGRDTHPWHLHGHTVLVLARNGRAPTGSPLLLDTFDVQPGEVWEVAFRAGNPGLWMNHCHNLSHADLGMALHLEYEGVTTPFHGAHGG